VTGYLGPDLSAYQPRFPGSARAGPTPGRHVNFRVRVRGAALAVYLVGASTAPALGVDGSAPPSAPPIKPVITPARIAGGFNLGAACASYYSLSSRAAHEQGATTVILYIDVDGRVTDTRIEIGSGYVALDEAAEHCVMEQGRFVPETIDSAAVGSWQRVKFNWRLDSPLRSQAAESLLSAYSKGDYVRLAKLLVPYARDGAIDAQLMLARMYLYGTGVTANASEAATWMRKAAEQGSTVAEYESGVLSREGIGGPKDYSAAATWFRKAAHQRHAEAAFNLALMYQSSLGVERDSAMALLWIDAAIGMLVPPSSEVVGPAYASTRASILAGMSPEEVDAASRIASAEGPVIRGFLRNRTAVEKAAHAAYPANLGVHSGLRTVGLLVFVLADGRVGDTRVETSSGLPRLDAVTAQVLSQAEIIPNKIGSRSVDAWQIVTWSWALH
jgi:TonB family protein